MIENFGKKLAAKQVMVEFGENDNVVLIERKFDEATGLPKIGQPIQTNTKHVEDLIADNERVIEPFLQKRKDLQDILETVKAKEVEMATAKDDAAAKLTKETDKKNG